MSVTRRIRSPPSAHEKIGGDQENGKHSPAPGRAALAVGLLGGAVSRYVSELVAVVATDVVLAATATAATATAATATTSRAVAGSVVSRTTSKYTHNSNGILEFNVPLDTVQVISETAALSSDVHLSFSNGGPAT